MTEIISQPKRNRISGVYEIVNTVNGHRYIGSSANVSKRWQEHTRDLNGNKHHSVYLQRAWTKYGYENFVFSVLETCEKVLLVEREQFYFDTIHPEYNNSPTARSPLGVKHSDETRRKVSEAGMGRVFSEEHKRKISEAEKGKIISPETRIKIGLKSIGRIFSDASRKKMSESGKMREHRRGYTLSDDAKKNISNSLLGNKFCLGRTPWNKGKKGLHKASYETRLKMSESRKGKSHSEETKRKMSEARKKYWENKRANE